jgi:hypothetical protein
MNDFVYSDVMPSILEQLTDIQLINFYMCSKDCQKVVNTFISYTVKPINIIHDRIIKDRLYNKLSNYLLNKQDDTQLLHHFIHTDNFEQFKIHVTHHFNPYKKNLLHKHIFDHSINRKFENESINWINSLAYSMNPDTNFSDFDSINDDTNEYQFDI